MISVGPAVKWNNLRGKSVYVSSPSYSLHGIVPQTNILAKSLLFNVSEGQQGHLWVWDPAFRAVFPPTIIKEGCFPLPTCQGALLGAGDECEQQWLQRRQGPWTTVPVSKHVVLWQPQSGKNKELHEGKRCSTAHWAGSWVSRMSEILW